MKFKYAYIALMLLISSACQKLDSISAPDFNVRIDTTTFRVGQEVLFRFSGDAGMITFFSGEPGSNYVARDGDSRIERLTVQFESHNEEAALPDEHEVASFRVMLSTDFEGKDRHYIGVNAANWTDVTERFTLSRPGSWSAANYVQSGAQSIMDLVEPGKPFHIAFHYEVPERTSTDDLTRRWRMRNFQLIGQTTHGDPVTIGTYAPENWSLISRDGPEASSSTAVAANVLFAPLTDGSQADVDEWLVSPYFVINDEEMGIGFGTGIKGYGNPAMEDFSYTYEQPGTYTATFVAINQNVEEKYEIFRQVRIIVLP